MSTTYLFIIGGIVVAYLIFMFGIRNLLVKKTQGVVTDCTAEEAMSNYLQQILQGFNPKDFQLVWGSTFANTDITRVFAYNDSQILVIPCKLLNGELVMPENQPSAAINLADVNHIRIGRKETIMRMPFVTLFFDAEDNDNNFDLWREKKDVCGNNNHAAFQKFIDFMENWAKEHNIPVEEI